MLLLFLLLAFLGGTPRTVERTCTAQHASIDGRTYWWHVHGREGNGEVRLISIRYGNETSKALKDCEQFLKHGFPFQSTPHGRENHKGAYHK